MKQKTSNSANLSVEGMTDAHIDTANKTITNTTALLKQLGYESQLPTIKTLLPEAINKGVQTAAKGVIQDPAGSAIGSGNFPQGGGGSGAIYSHFSDLKPIPAIAPTESVFNESEQDGGRVLHSYSPHIGHLGAAPLVLDDFKNAVRDLSNSYLNAFLAIKLLPPAPGTAKEFLEFGAVPLAGRIFARNFKNADLNHLHPGMTIASILIAQAEMVRRENPLPSIKLYYFGKSVYQEALNVLSVIDQDLTAALEHS